MRREWIQTVVRISFGKYAFSAEYVEGVRTLKKIENWLAEHHLARPMFDAYGFPRFPSGNITVTFGAADAEKTMAYRVFCNTLGLGRSLSQYRIVQPIHSRTTPPAERAAFF